MICPVCSQPALDATENIFDRVMMDCPHCGLYAVARTALPRLNQWDAVSRAAALLKARNEATSTAPPTITNEILSAGPPILAVDK